MSLSDVKIPIGGNYEPVLSREWIGCQCIGMSYSPVDDKAVERARAGGYEPKPQLIFRFEVDEKIERGEKAGWNKEVSAYFNISLYLASVGGKGQDSGLGRFLADYLGIDDRQVGERFGGSDASKIQEAVVGASGRLKVRPNAKGNVRPAGFERTPSGMTPFRGTNAARASSFPPQDGPGNGPSASQESSAQPPQGVGTTSAQQGPVASPTPQAGQKGVSALIQEGTLSLGGASHNDLAGWSGVSEARLRFAWSGAEPPNPRFELTAEDVTAIVTNLAMSDADAEALRSAWAEKRR